MENGAVQDTQRKENGRAQEKANATSSLIKETNFSTDAGIAKDVPINVQESVALTKRAADSFADGKNTLNIPKRDSVHAQEKASATSLLTKETNFSTDAVIARSAPTSAQESAVLTKNADANPANNAGDIPNIRAMFL